MLAPGCLTGRSAWLCTPFPSMMQSAALPHSAPGICWPPVQAGIRQCPASWLTTVTLMISCAFPFRPPISYMIPSQAGLYSVLFSLPGSFPLHQWPDQPLLPNTVLWCVSTSLCL